MIEIEFDLVVTVEAVPAVATVPLVLLLLLLMEVVVSAGGDVSAIVSGPGESGS